ncbi:MAG: hypothetical protein ACK4QW_04715 [Alphaproteobacteria bacterium]
MNQTVDLGTVLGNTFANLSWTGFTLVCAIILVGILWCILPFAVFGVKRRLDAIESAQRQQTELLIGELRRTNELLARRSAGGSAVAAADPWEDAAPSSLYPDDVEQRAPVATSFRNHRGNPPPPRGDYVPYPDDPRPVERGPAERDRWARGGRRFARTGG